MLDEEVWGVTTNELCTALSSMHSDVQPNMFQLLGRLGKLMLNLVMWREVKPMECFTDCCFACAWA